MVRCAVLALLVALATVSAIPLIHHINVPDDGAERVFLQTIYGPIPVKLLPENAPTVVKAVKDMVGRTGSCSDCAFYRNEARPKPDQGLGPPYGLLQGRLDLSEPYPKVEGNISVKAGHVALIPGTEEFFIALSDHPEWGTSHAVWGEIEDWFATDFIAAHDYKESKHPDYGTIMRMLKDEYTFTVTSTLSAAPVSTA